MASLEFNQNEITIPFLESCRHITDELADNVIKQVIDSGNAEHLNAVFVTLVSNHTFNEQTFKQFEGELKLTLDKYFIDSAQLPDWYDADKIKVGEQVFAEFGPEIFMLLNVSSLPMCYTCAKGAQVLFDTGRLMTHYKDMDPLVRRLMETGQMIFNVMSPGGLSADGTGLVTIQKVRLIHASIRYYLKYQASKNGFQWDAHDLGEPINQEDLAGTLMSFAPVILKGLERLDINLSENQIEGYLHCWQVVGHLMGIKEALIPDTYENAFDLANKILKHQADTSESGIALTASCINFINHTMPGNIFRGVPEYMIQYFLQDFEQGSGKPLAQYIGLKDGDNKKDDVALRLTKFFTKDISKLEHHKFIQEISGVFNKVLLKSIIHHFNENKSVHFYIPPSLTQNWNLNQNF
ncbi:oxygenase MpaB family protein [Marivirga atlantica]|uniref:DUF2236 domain-containing protein n=1 Tax=Marivirga atlantica TaxID=1548457 RepID=A0A937A8S3_9BACT|nr:oxygenase MpaB family protein [Marivirga atlantica]MBL0765877.1 DUF2236 domain-containing protein [Marivirga atlantica]